MTRLPVTFVVLCLASCSPASAERIRPERAANAGGSVSAASGGASAAAFGGALPAITPTGLGGALNGGLGGSTGGTFGTPAMQGGSSSLGGGGLGGAPGAPNGAGGSGGLLTTSGGASAILPSGELTWIAVGYAGRRIRSTNLGQTWTDDQTLGGGGDDEFLLRGVAFAKGVFVALGYQIHTSTDGVVWQRETNPENQWLQGIRVNGDRFVSTGGYGYSAYSLDGHMWKKAGDLMTEASRSLAFGGGVFMTATDPGNWWSSADGASWTKVSGGHASSAIAYCGAEFREVSDCTGDFTAIDRVNFEGITVKVADGKIQRSEDGTNFQTIVDSGPALIAITAGYVAP